MKKPKLRKPPKPRNVIAKELLENPLFRKRIELSTDEKEAKHDRWNRKAKHKKAPDEG